MQSGNPDLTYNELLKTIAAVLGTTHEYYDFFTSTAAKVSNVACKVVQLVLTSRSSSDSRTLLKTSTRNTSGPGHR